MKVELKKENKVIEFLKPIANGCKKVLSILKQWKGIVVFVDTKSMFLKSHDWVLEITQRGDAINSKNIPADLRQTNTRTILTRSGKPTAGYTLPSDWSYGEDAAISQLYITTGIIAMVILNVFGITSFGSLSNTLGINFFSTTALIIGGSTFAFAVIVMNILGTQRALYSGLIYLIVFGILFSVINLNTNNVFMTVFAYTLPALLMWYMSYNTDKKRAFQLTLQAESHNGILNEEFISDDETANPLVAQMRKTIEDKSPFIPIGIATGKMQRNGDVNAPDSGVEVGLTKKDAGQHIFIEGATGTGKSWLLNALLCRFYVNSILEGSDFGLFTGDGKGELPFQLRTIQDAIIAPHLIKNLNFIKGLRPEQRMNILLVANNDSGDAGANQIFRAGGAELGYYAALTQDRLVEMKDIIDPSIEKISSSFNYWEVLAVKLIALGKLDHEENCISHPIIDLLKQHPNYGKDKSIDRIIVYINKMQKPKNRELVESFLANFISWVSPISQNTRLYDWNDSEESDIDIYDILKGKKYGVSLKTEDYGIAGAIITQFIKASLFNRLALRDDGWRDNKEEKDVLFVLDECQDIVNNDDTDQAQKARSRGIILIYATQHKTNLQNKLTEAGADSLMLSFLNRIQLRTGDAKSIDFIKNILGKIRMVITSASVGDPINFSYTNEISMRNPEFNSDHPEAHFIKFNGSSMKATRKFFGSLAKDGSRVNDLSNHQNYATYKYNEDSPMRDLVTPEIIKSLDVPHHAIVMVQRGGMPRNDVVKVYGMSSQQVAIEIEKARKIVAERNKLNLKKAA